MRDPVSIPRVLGLHPFIVDDVRSRIEQAELRLGPNAAVRIIQGLRTFAIQDTLFQIGRTVKGSNARPGRPMGDIVTNARAGQSPHQYGLAVDFAIIYDKDHNGTFESLSWDMVADLNRDGEADWKEVVDVFTAAGFVWGGNWHSLKDNPHFEKTNGLSWQHCLVKYNSHDFIPGTEFINLAA